MALQKDYDKEGTIANNVNAYHKIKGDITNYGNKTVIIIIGIYKDSASSSDIANEICERRILLKNINGGDQNFDDYVDTVHATDNKEKRLEQYLIDKEADYTSAIVV